MNLDVPVGGGRERLLLLLLILFFRIAHEDIQLRQRRRWRVLVVVVVLDLVVRLELRHVLLLGDGVGGANLGVFTTTLLPAAEEGLEGDVLGEGVGCVPQHCKEEIVRKKVFINSFANTKM